MFRRLFFYTFLLLVLILILTAWANQTIEADSEAFIHSDTSGLPACKTAVLLGTSNKMRNGTPNDFFYNRIKAAVELFHTGKVKNIIVSGDNSLSYYNEPELMQKELIKAGIPDSVIYLDYAGFRTFDSMIRAREIFGQTKFIVVSQEFHNRRAVFIARRNGIEAYGYNAKDVEAYKGFKTKFREFFARLKVFIDIYTNKQPKFLGDKVLIN
ncbi:MAG: SanA/YdcF family protein [Bacteroidia bacterium]